MQSFVVFDRNATMEGLKPVSQGQEVALNEVSIVRRTSLWTAAHVSAIAAGVGAAIPLITADQVRAIVPGTDFWDMWPVQLADGTVASFDGATLWMILSAPIFDNPDERHAVARIRLVSQRGDVWRDCGNAMPDDFSPGSREWAGSAILDPMTNKLTLYFTAAGRRGEPKPTVEQRLFQTSGDLKVDGACAAQVSNWSPPQESFTSDDYHYVRVDQVEGELGHIKAFRDPAFFRDPVDGACYLLFTGSLKQSSHAFNGAIGIARAINAECTLWALLPPIVEADSLNNELERPHVIARGGLYYLFWSTQRRVFAPEGPAGPSGLYGMVASSLFGPYRPINDTGLVAANPASEPLQAYSWLVLDTLEVVSFVDHWGLSGRRLEDHPELRRAQFGGTPAPRFKLALDGDSANILSR
jgi:levansucrase